MTPNRPHEPLQDEPGTARGPSSPDVSALVDSLDRGLQAMATYASAPMDLWDRFSNDVLKARSELTRLAAEVEQYKTAICAIDERCEQLRGMLLEVTARAEKAEAERLMAWEGSAKYAAEATVLRIELREVDARLEELETENEEALIESGESTRNWQKAKASLSAERARRESLEAALTPSADTKAAYIGEIRTVFADRDEFGDERSVNYALPWDTIKDVMKLIRARAALLAKGRDDGR